MFIYTLNWQKLRTVRLHEGRYLLRTNLTENDPALLWQYYIQLVAVEQAFKNLKGDLAIRPVWPELTDEGVRYAFWYKLRTSGRVGKRRGRGSKRLESVVGL
jgi:hypothetical protein